MRQAARRRVGGVTVLNGAIEMSARFQKNIGGILKPQSRSCFLKALRTAATPQAG
jgi:hypothetical protein